MMQVAWQHQYTHRLQHYYMRSIRHELHTLLSPLLQAQLEKQLSQLQELCVHRRELLGESQRYHVYLRETAELDEWIAVQGQVACSEEYGEDYEHLQVSGGLQGAACRGRPEGGGLKGAAWRGRPEEAGG